MKRIILFTAFLVGGFGLVQAQRTLLKTADREFQSFNYAHASALYLEAFEKKNTVHAAEGLATSYYMMRNFRDAENWYGRLANSDNATAEQILKYGHTLRNNSKFLEAKNQYARLESRNDRNVSLDELQLLYRSCDSAMVWVQNPRKSQQVDNAQALNSRNNDFGLVRHGSRYLFASDRADGVVTDQKVYGWTGKPFLRVYAVDADFSGSVEHFPVSWYNRDHHIGPASVNASSGEVYFAVTRELTPREKRKAKKLATVNVEIYSNALDANDWGRDAKPFKYNNITQWSVGDPFLSLSGDTLYFVSDMPGGFGGTDIYYVTRDGHGNWGDALNLGPSVNTAQNERFPSLDPNGYLYFSSTGHIGMGGLDVFVLEKGKANSAPRNMGYPLNSPADDFGIYFVDKVSGYIASNRFGGVGGDDFYQFLLDRKIQLDLKGRVINANTGLPVSQAKVVLSSDKEPNDIEIYTNADGTYWFNLKPEHQYTIVASQTGFKPFVPEHFSTLHADSSQTLVRDLRLVPVEKEEVVVLRNIYFDFDKSEIRPDAAFELSKIHSFLISNPDARIELSAHTDSRGTHEYNMALSQRRAESAVAFLVASGIDASRLVARGYGFTKLANQCAKGVECTEAEHEFNRRVEFFILK